MIGSVIGLVAECGVSRMMGYAVRAITPAAEGKVAKLAMKAGAVAVSAIIGAAVKEQVDETYTSIKNTIANTDLMIINVENHAEEEEAN